MIETKPNSGVQNFGTPIAYSVDKSAESPLLPVPVDYAQTIGEVLCGICSKYWSYPFVKYSKYDILKNTQNILLYNIYGFNFRFRR